ncbi:hypothetical protein LTS14_001982 [Recurvomyces mirabilis]|nr:hypothetical protein LTS14_001982 [Recurvomyces mirabilis]
MDPIITENPDGTIHAIYYLYHPSKAAGWAFLVLFGILTLGHFVAMFPFRSKFVTPLVIGGIMETFGYYGRAWAGSKSDNIGPWALQALLIMSAPPLISATVYMSFGRLISVLEEQGNALMRPKWITPVFLTGDIIAFISQIAGVGLQTTTSQSIQATGQKVVIAGLVFQLILLLCFLANLVVFNKRTNENPTTVSENPQLPRWRLQILSLCISTACIWVRNLVRIAEYGQGPKGSIAAHEVFLYIFDAVPMCAVLTLLLVIHPGRFLQRARRLKPATVTTPDEPKIEEESSRLV